MLLKGLSIDKDIIDIDNHAEVEHIVQDGLDHRLEGYGGINHAKVYNGKLEEAIPITEYRLLFVAFLDPNKVKTTLKVDLSKELSASKPILKLYY